MGSRAFEPAKWSVINRPLRYESYPLEFLEMFFDYIFSFLIPAPAFKKFADKYILYFALFKVCILWTYVFLLTINKMLRQTVHIYM